MNNTQLRIEKNAQRQIRSSFDNINKISRFNHLSRTKNTNWKMNDDGCSYFSMCLVELHLCPLFMFKIKSGSFCLIITNCNKPATQYLAIEDFIHWFPLVIASVSFDHNMHLCLLILYLLSDSSTLGTWYLIHKSMVVP